MGEKELQAIKEREEQILQIEGVWTRLCRLSGKPVRFAELDRKINDLFEVLYGRDSLAFDSFDVVLSLLKAEEHELLNVQEAVA